MFDQLKQEVKVEESRLGITVDGGIGEEKLDIMGDSQQEELKFMSRQDIMTLQQKIIEHTQKQQKQMLAVEALNQEGIYGDVAAILS